MSREHVLPPVLGKVHVTRRTPLHCDRITTPLACALHHFQRRNIRRSPGTVHGTRCFLQLTRRHCSSPVLCCAGVHGVEHKHFRGRRRSCRCWARSACAFPDGPWTSRDPARQLPDCGDSALAIGVVLWVVTVFVNHAAGVSRRPIQWKTSAGAGAGRHFRVVSIAIVPSPERGSVTSAPASPARRACDPKASQLGPSQSARRCAHRSRNRCRLMTFSLPTSRA